MDEEIKENGHSPPVKKMRMMDSLPKGCGEDNNTKENIPQVKMRMVDSLPKGCDDRVKPDEVKAEKGENGEGEVEFDDFGDPIVKENKVDENGQPIVEEKKEYQMITFNFKKANNWFKATDLLTRDLSLDPRLKHYLPQVIPVTGDFGPGDYGPGDYGPGDYGPGDYGRGHYFIPKFYL